MKTLLRHSSILAAFAASVLPLHATVTFLNGYTGTAAEVNSSTELAYQADVSSSDLLNGLPATVSNGWKTTNGANLSELNDGIHGVNFTTAGNSIEGAWTTEGIDPDTSATFLLGSNPYGYDITSVLSVAAWQGSGIGNQVWQLEVRPVGGSFTLLATIDYQPLSGAGATKVTLSDLDATGIDAIRITANDIANSTNGSVWRELDVIGTAAIPEPSSAVLLAAFSGFFFLRRQR